MECIRGESKLNIKTLNKTLKLNNMNRYHLEIMPGNQPPFDIIVEADDMNSNSDGFYRFSNRIKENDSISYSQTTAYYPISRTIISKIESNIAP